MAEYIEREAAYKDFEKCNSENPKWTPSRVKALIARQKAADVATVVHGRWEKWNGDDRHHCTVCECYANTERDSYGYIAYEFLDKYCPNCGARMDNA